MIIGGFAVRGAGQKRILVRGLGPILADFKVPNVLTNPSLTVYQGQTVLATNDDWATASNVAEIMATGKAPTKALESAILLSLPEGDYTAVVRGVGANPTGAGLVQVYDLDPSSSPKLQSISTRCVVGADDDVMIGGVNIVGSGTQKVVIRGIGPSLTQYGVAGALGNPTLRIANANGDTVAENDDWANGTSAAELGALGQAPPGAAGALEAAVVLKLSPGAYTAIVSGVGRTAGVALVQVTKLD